MKIINIEASAFEEMLAKFETLVERVDEITRKTGGRRISDWLDGGQVCLLMRISPRSLQTLRDSGKISFSQIGHKIYYKLGDVEKAVQYAEKMQKNERIRQTLKQESYVREFDY